MIQTIRLHHLLRESVAGTSRHLVTRPTGAAVRGEIERALQATACVTALLDFADVELLDFSCADEVVAKLLMGASGTLCYVVLWNLRDDQVEAVDHVLRHHGLAVAAMPAGNQVPHVLGLVDDDARRAFGRVLASGPITAPTLARQLDWAPARAEQALHTLAEHRLAREQQGAFHPLPLP